MAKENDILSLDERMLLALLRADGPSRRRKMFRETLEAAVRRCLPHRRLREFIPSRIGDEPLTGGAYDDNTTLGQVQNILEKLGGLDWAVLGSAEDFRSSGEIAAQHSEDTLAKHGSTLLISADMFSRFLSEWRSNIFNACQTTQRGMARTEAEAEVQSLDVPDRFEDWIDFALTLDGELIAEENGYPTPGEHDVEFDLADPTLTNVALRLNLYEKLRFLCEHGRDPLTPSESEKQQIMAALAWLRKRKTVVQAETRGTP
jgi:hypothetical protein